MVSTGSGRGQAESGGEMPRLSGWKDLPRELLLRIISIVGDDRMVIVASGVCTGWRDALGWGVTNLSLSWCQQNMNNLMISLAHKFTKLQFLSLCQNKPQLEDSAVEAVANYCHDLRELDLSRSFRLSDRSLYALAHGCPRLTRLNISECSSFSDTALTYLSCHCKNLKCLNLYGCGKAATDRALQAIARNCGQLQSLNLGLCEDMNNLMMSLAHKFTKLQVLTLCQNKSQLEDSAVEAVANYCHDLRELDLSRSFWLSDRSLYALAHGCPRLTRLNISGCSSLSDIALTYLSCRCKNLKCLNLCGCGKAATDRALQAIARDCGQLQSLNLGWCDHVTDKGVTSLASGCPDLRALDVCGCVLITDESVIAVANGCPHMRSLGLYYCHNITDRAMYSLANSRVKSKRGRWDTVRSSRSKEEDGLANLNISQCTALTAPAVQAVCDSFPALHTCPERHSLIISGCLSLTSVHCACALHPHRAGRTMLPSDAY